MGKYLVYGNYHVSDYGDVLAIFGAFDDQPGAIDEMARRHEFNTPGKTYERVCEDHMLWSDMGMADEAVTRIVEVPDTDALLFVAVYDTCATIEPYVTVFGFESVGSARESMLHLYDLAMSGRFEYEYDAGYSHVSHRDIAECGIETRDYQLDMMVLHGGNEFGHHFAPVSF